MATNHEITISEIINGSCNTYSVKDDSPRGVHTAYKDEIKVGDKVVINNYFTTVIDDPKKDTTTDTTNTTTKETIINEIINIFENDTDLFNDCIEQLDSWNGYLNDDRFYPMDEIDEILCNKKPSEIMYLTFFGHDMDGYTTDINGIKHYCEFNPNADYFRFNGYGNLVSTNYIDYSDHIDSYTIEALMENRTEIDAIETDDKLMELFDKLEEVEQ